MCETTASVLVLVGPETRKIDEPIPGRVPVDTCIAAEVEGLNELRVLTIGSCCGHGSSPGWIAAPSSEAGLLRALGYSPRAASSPNHEGQLEVLPASLAKLSS